MAKAKGIKKAKVKVSVSDDNKQLNNETNKPPEVVSSMFPVYVIPDKNEKLTSVSKIMVNNKVKDFKILTDAPFDINSLSISDALKKLFNTVLNEYDLVNTRLTYHNASYGPCFGFCMMTDSYKAMVSHHKGNGINALVVNQNGFFLYTMAVNTFKKHDVAISKGKGNWGVVNVNDSNMDNIIKSMIDLGIIKAKVSDKQG